MENFISKLNKKFNLFYLVYAGLDVLSELCYILYLIITYSKNKSWYAAGFIQEIMNLIFICGLVGLGVYFIVKKDEGKLRKLMILMTVVLLYRYFYNFMYIPGKWFYKGQSVFYVFYNIGLILYYLFSGIAGITFLSNVFFKKDVFKTVISWSVVALIAVEVYFFVTDFIGLCSGAYPYWYAFISELSTVAYLLVILLALHKYNLFDLSFVKDEKNESSSEETKSE